MKKSALFHTPLLINIYQLHPLLATGAEGDFHCGGILAPGKNRIIHSPITVPRVTTTHKPHDVMIIELVVVYYGLTALMSLFS